MSVVHAAAEAVWMSMIHDAVCKESSFAVLLMIADSWLSTRDIESFCDIHPLKKKQEIIEEMP